jgi:DNA sulfur modification protein DndD
MKLVSLQVCNFRQFYGKTPPIIFASGEKNTTVIYGNNGAGKTSLLNAFTWVLYEKFTAAFASPELLINKRAITETANGKALECWAELIFERDRKQYQIKRKCYATKKENNLIEYSPSKIFILIAGEDGRWYPPLEPAESIIEGILPSSLHQYFFFDGERIDSFFRNGKNNNIAEDTKELLGVKVLDRAIEHLRKAKKTLQEELQQLGDSKTKSLITQQIELETITEDLEKRDLELKGEIIRLETQQIVLSEKLLAISGAEELQKLKQQYLNRQAELQKKIIQIKNNLKQILSQSSHRIFLAELTENFKDLIQQLRDRGTLELGLKPQFIQQLLTQQQCICGNPLAPQTNSYQNVRSWLDKIEHHNIEESVVYLERQIETFPQQINDIWQQIDRKQNNLNELYLESNNIENELSRIDKKLANHSDRDIQKIHKDLKIIEQTIKQSIWERAANQQQSIANRQELAKLNEAINKCKITETKQALAQTRIQATQEAISRLIEVRIRLEKQFRLALEAKVREIFTAISFTPYLPKLSPDYELTLIENTSGFVSPVAASTGENQILSLSFIGGIIDRVREWSRKDTIVGLDSSTFPIVMDSPFGSLDHIYRRQVARSIPQLANQLVILATKTQWRGEVENEIIDRIGREYVLIYNSPKPNCELDWLKLNDINYPLVRVSPNNFEYTEILKIERK